MNIFQLAIEKYNDNYENIKSIIENEKKKDNNKNRGVSSSFGEIVKVVKSINYSNDSVNIKKNNIISFKNYIKQNSEKKILGVNKDIFKMIFQLTLDDNHNFSIEERLYYISYLQRLVVSEVEPKVLVESLEKEREIIDELQKEEKEKLRLIEEEERRLEEERIQKEEEEKRARRESMTEGEKIKEDINNLEREEREGFVTEILKNINNYNDEIDVAKALKEYYVENGAWDGKVSKKVKMKVEKIKSILKEV